MANDRQYPAVLCDARQRADERVKTSLKRSVKADLELKRVKDIACHFSEDSKRADDIEREVER